MNTLHSDKKNIKRRNPPWQREELILALDLFFRHNPSHISQDHDEVIKLSEILNRLPIHIERIDHDKFRNPNGVYMKLCNFLRHDPNYHGTGLQRGGKLEEEIWKEFANNREFLHQEAKRIIDSIKNNKTEVAITKDGEEDFREQEEPRRIIRNNISFPFTVYSWTILAPNIFLKILDKSAFYHHGTGIPIEIRKFFNVHQLFEGERRDIILEHNKVQYQAHIEMESTDTLRTRMFWRSDFSSLLQKSLPKWYELFAQEVIDAEEFPKMRFHKDEKEDHKYLVEFINPDTIYGDIIRAESGTSQSREEGEVKYQITKTYERNPTNRRKALEIHGLSCVVCGFNFGEVYGELGEGFIEVHHVGPLSQIDRKHPIDPRTDLVPICPNCHSMVHRVNDEVLTIEQLKKIIRKHQR